MKIIELSKIGFFNPGRLSDEEIELSFIARQPDFELIFQSIAEENKNSIPQHHLIVGQRGMGKTSLLLRIGAELRKSKYANSFVALTFPEEQYNVDRLSKFWLNCLDALADALDREEQKETAAELDKQIAALDRNQQKDPQIIYIEFEKWCDKLKRRPVLLVDNLNLIFSKISIDEQHQLRAILMKKNAPIMLGASAVVPEETIQYGAPFYDGFSMHYIKKLSFEESMRILVNLGKITGVKDYEEIAWKNKGRLGALYHLTGGTPRTISMLFPLIKDGFSEAIQSDLDALLDMVTPLYKAKFEELSDQQQVILDAIALHWDPMTLAGLREVSQLENSVLSAQLKRLMDIGWIQKLDQEKKKFPAYEITERFFNIWYLMRRSSRRQKQELYCLSKFLEVFYGPEVSNLAMKRLETRSETANQIALDLALAGALKENPELAKLLENKGWDDLMELSKNDPDMLNDFDIPKIKKIEEIRKVTKQLSSYVFKADYKNCVLQSERLKSLGGEMSIYHYYQGKGNDGLGNIETAYKFFRKYIENEPSNTDVLNALGNYCQDFFGNYAESENYYKMAIKIEPSESVAVLNLVFLLRDQIGRVEEADELFSTVKPTDEHWDSYYLNKALFSYYSTSLELSEVALALALSKIGIVLPLHTQDDWWRTGAVVVRLGYGQHFLDQLASHGYDVILRPYYTSIQALMHENSELFLNSVASEVREPARKILEFMRRYNQGHTIKKPKLV